MITNLKRRVAKLERLTNIDLVYELPNGSVRGMHRSWLLDAMHYALTGVDHWLGHVLLTAVSVNDGSHIHELVQALAAGPNLKGAKR